MSFKPVGHLQVIEKERGYGVWKPHGVPTTRGNEFCFLQICDLELRDTDWRQTQKLHFGKDEEWGLINRLDNDTAGYVWFAKDSAIKEHYLNLQSKGMIIKKYIAIVCGNLQGEKYVDIPMMHHRSQERMICATSDQVKYGTGSLIFVGTAITPIMYNSILNQTRVSIEIKNEQDIRLDAIARIFDFRSFEMSCIE